MKEHWKSYKICKWYCSTSITSKGMDTLVVASRPKIRTRQHTSNGYISKTIWHTLLKFGVILFPHRPNPLAKFRSNRKESGFFVLIWHGIVHLSFLYIHVCVCVCVSGFGKRDHFTPKPFLKYCIHLYYIQLSSNCCLFNVCIYLHSRVIHDYIFKHVYKLLVPEITV